MKRFFLIMLVTVPVLSVAQGIVWRSYKASAFSQATAAKEVVIQTQGAFDTYWRELTGDRAAPRDIDFTKELLIAVQLGQRNSGGFKALIRSIERTRPNEITVSYEEHRPAPGGLATTVMTSPFEIVRVERKSAVGAFVFKKKDVIEGGTGGGSGTGMLNWRTYQCDLVGGGSSEFTRVIANSREWDTYWRSLGFGGVAPSDVDWNTEMLVAIHLGSRPTDGYDVVVDELVAVNNGFGITYIEKAPSLGQRTRRATTSPYVIIRLPKLAGQIQFRKRVWRSDGL